MTDRMAGFARELVKNEAARNSSIPTITARTQLVPFPLVGIISPWNFPFLLGMIDSIPALIAGSAILYKPSEITPRHADPVRECFNQVPELADVVDYAMGAGATGQAVIDNVDAVCFTGSVRTGRLVAERAASNFIPAFLEMGGKDPAIVPGIRGPRTDRHSAAARISSGNRPGMPIRGTHLRRAPIARRAGCAPSRTGPQT